MANKAPVDASAARLPAIGKALAYLCLQEAQRKRSEEVRHPAQAGEVPARASAESEAGSGLSAVDKNASLLALIATRDMDTDAAALKLDAIGFGAIEISTLLEVGPNYVNVARHRKMGRSSQPRKKA